MIKASVQFKIDPIKALEALRQSTRTNILKKAIRRGANIMKDDVKNTAPKLTGALRTSISVKISAYKGGTLVMGLVGPRSKYQKTIRGAVHKPTKYAHFLETNPAYRPFLEPAYQRHKNAYLTTVNQVCADEIAKRMKK